MPPPFGFKDRGKWWWWDKTTSDESILDSPAATSYVRKYPERLFPNLSITLSDRRTAPTAGLDLHVLRGIAARRRGQSGYQQLLDRIAAHLDEHDGFVSWSGGKDSTVVVDLARQVDPHIPVVFFDSGLQFPETMRYLEELAEVWRLNYQVIAAEPDLLTVLIACGGFDHNSPDRQLRGPLADIMITGPAAEAHTRYGRGSLWGVRAEESNGRRALYRAA